MIARWPGKIKPGAESDLISDFSDFLPTACDIAGIKPPKDIDGISFLNELLGKKQKKHDFLYWEFFKYNYNWKTGDDPKIQNTFDNQAIRMGKWKAVCNDVAKNPDAKLELYDLSTDIGEIQDVASDHLDIVSKMEKLIKKTRFDVEFFSKKK
jgi:arylsulfatase A-like enzyme